MTVSRYRFLEIDQPYFMTCTVVGWLPVFARPSAVQIVLDSWKYLIDNRNLRLFAYVVLENHLHFISQSPDIAQAVQDFKSYTAHKLLALFREGRAETILRQLAENKSESRSNRTHQLWIEGSHPEQILSFEMLMQKLNYTHDNPVKRGYVDEPEHWRYSSARNYHGREGLIPVYTEWLEA